MDGYGVYALVFDTKPVKKVYIGSTARSFKVRKMEHTSRLKNKRHPNRHLQALWDKNGDFVFEILEECKVDDADLITRQEQMWMDRMGQAFTLINFGPPMPCAAYGKKQSEETIRKRVASMKNYYKNPEAIKRRQEIARANWDKPGYRENMKEKQKAYITPEYRKKLSEALIKANANPETSKRRSDANRRRKPISEETRIKMSESQKLRYSRPEERQKASDVAKSRKKISEETRQKLSKITSVRSRLSNGRLAQESTA